MPTQPKRYQALKPFLRYWRNHFETVDAQGLVDSLSIEGMQGVTLDPKWSDYVTAFRRLRQDARLRVVRRFLAELEKEDAG